MSYANFVKVKLAAAATSGDTTLSVAIPAGAYQPPPAGGGTLTLTDSLSQPTKMEVVTYTGRTGSGPYTLTGVARAQEGTTAQAWGADAPVFMALTAGQYNADLGGKEPTITTGTTSQFWRGDKAWRDFATDVRASVMTGLSTASAVAVAATDTVLAAIGKLQAQIDGLSAANYTNLTLVSPFTWDSAGDSGSYHPPSYAKVGDVVRLRGKVTLSGTHADASTVNITIIATLPAGFRPAKRKAFQVLWDTDSPLHFAYCLVFVNTDGAIVLLVPGSTQPYPFTEGHLPLDQIWFDLAL